MIKIFCDENSEFYLQIAEYTYKYLSISGKCSVELVITDAKDIQRLNLDFRGIDKETDVLSFPSIDFSKEIKKFDKKNYSFDYDISSDTVVLGSIVINEGMAKTQAEEYGHSIEREKAYLFLHGLLHIFGYDHMIESDKKIMRNLEERILNNLGLGIDN